MMKKLLTNPLYAIIAVILIWQILNFILINKSVLSRKTWVRLEYIWIVIGFMGVISIILENDINYKKNDLRFSENWVENQFESLLNYSEKATFCFQYKRSDWLPAEEFDRRQAESDKICNWVKEKVIPILKESKKNGYSKIEKYERIELEDFEGSYTAVPDRITEDINLLNSYILNRDKLRKETSTNHWLGFQYSLGVILLIFAFAIRLTLVTKKVKTE